MTKNGYITGYIVVWIIVFVVSTGCGSSNIEGIRQVDSSKNTETAEGVIALPAMDTAEGDEQSSGSIASEGDPGDAAKKENGDSDNGTIQGQVPMEEKFIAFMCSEINIDQNDYLDRLAIVKMDGSNFRIINEDALVYGPFWSPNGRFIVYEIQDVIYLFDPVRPEGPKVVASGRWPAWAPDSDRIAYIAFRLENGHLKWGFDIINIAGNLFRNIPINTGEHGSIHHTTWSPNGEMIAYTITDYPDGTDQGIVYNLEIVEMNTGEQRRLTNFPIKTTITDNFNLHALYWSPDSNYIFFSYHSPTNKGKHLMVVSADGSQEVDLGPGVALGWSPGGSELLYQLSHEIWVAKPDGTDRAKVVEDGSQGGWSPDGSGIIYLNKGIKVKNRDGNQEIFSIDIDNECRPQRFLTMQP